MATASDEFDDRLLGSIDRAVDELTSCAPDELPTLARSFVTTTLSARRPDGTAPPPALVQEVLRSVLDAVDEPLAAALAVDPSTASDVAWVVAWRECADDPELLGRMSAAMDAEPGDHGAPPVSPLAHGELTIADPDDDRRCGGRS